ncbi:osmotic avoidance abnormal protein 3 [Culicoides brevitarsis]|uniref:osmotic avoidance abnormal protein 3 n=1 Tax=Culicoides brevitarsis TaxID=469753 RepID=UPI00307C87EB
MKMGENVKVIVRCRPMNRKEMDMKCKSVVHVKDCSVTLENASDLSAPSKMFTFDSAYDMNSNTEAIYNDICYSLVESVLEGYNGTIFAYGQTGCGKSHTMTGPSEIFEKSTPELNAQRGIISRSFEHIFEAIAVATDVRYLALVSYLEIYNENIRDLLNPSADTNNLQLKELPGEGVTVHNLSMHTVQNVRECEQLLIQGNKNRMVGATLMNAGSSRSHSIFTISVEQVSINNKDANDKGNIKKGKLNLVDLAGSERQAKTGATGDRLKEATKINLSLSALGNVISALVDGKTKHIPYRDSKLTRLLQDSLGGNTKTLMIACISPAAYNYDETLSTLRYASRAKNISNKPRVNEDPKDALMREYQEEINRLKSLLQNNNTQEMAGNPISDQNSAHLSQEWLENEKSKLQSEFEAEKIRLKREHEAQKIEKQELQKDIETLKAHYEKQLDLLSKKQDQNNNNQPVSTEEIMNRIESIKATLIGGERANDLQLKEKRYKKKLAAQRKLSALAHVLGRIEQSSDRDLLKEHYTDIHQELQAKTEALRGQKKKVLSLEREITDLQSEFQLDRADYLETIRKLERNQRFYEQMLDKAVPLLRKDGKFWDIEAIKCQSEWNDDAKKWKLPDEPFSKLCMLPAIEQKQAQQQRFGRENTSLTAPGRLERSSSIISIISLHEQDPSTDDDDNHNNESLFLKKISNQESENIVSTYFRPKRVTELMQQSQNWTGKDSLNPIRKSSLSHSISTLNRINSSISDQKQPLSTSKIGNLNKTWAGGAIQNIVNKNNNKFIEDNSLSSKVFRPTAAHRNGTKLT